jgi:hypothetical protein
MNGNNTKRATVKVFSSPCNFGNLYYEVWDTVENKAVAVTGNSRSAGKYAAELDGTSHYEGEFEQCYTEDERNMRTTATPVLMRSSGAR